MTGELLRTEADDLLEQGQLRAMALVSFLFDSGRLDEVQRAANDHEYFKELLARFESGRL